MICKLDFVKVGQRDKRIVSTVCWAATVSSFLENSPGTVRGLPNAILDARLILRSEVYTRHCSPIFLYLKSLLLLV